MDATTREVLAAILRAWDEDATWVEARDLMERARSVLSQEPGGARTPQKTCSKCGHAWHQWDGRSMCDVDGGCLCGGDIPEPAPSPSPGEAPRELNSAERERISALLDAHERVVLLCEPPGCSQAEYDEAAGRMIHARDLMVAALRSAAPPSAESDLEALQKLCDEATPGPLEAVRLDADGREAFKKYVGGCINAGEEDAGFYLVWTGEVDVCHTGNGPTSWANAKFIAAARTALPALIAELRALRRAGGRT